MPPASVLVGGAPKAAAATTWQAMAASLATAQRIYRATTAVRRVYLAAGMEPEEVAPAAPRCVQYQPPPRAVTNLLSNRTMVVSLLISPAYSLVYVGILSTLIPLSSQLCCSRLTLGLGEVRAVPI